VAALPLRVGLVGCGDISGIYLENARTFVAFDIVACADLLPERAAAKAAEFGIPKACSLDELLADPDIDIVLNLTVPRAHAEVALAALAADKSVYNEKPLAITRQDGRRILEAAEARGLRVGCAPDTFLGGAWQTARKLIDAGAIGEPVAATAFMMCHGHENWHPDPEFHYQVGGGPLFDMGPYYLTALIHLLGPVRRVTGAARATFSERTITSAPKRGQKIQVETPTHIAAVLEFADGPIATLVTSFDVWHAEVPFIEIYGSMGSMSLPDPNTFGGAIRVRRARDAAWEDVPLEFGYVGNDRGLGLADMAAAIASGRAHRASGALAFHVLDVMHGVLEAARAGQLEVGSEVGRPEPLSKTTMAGT
jgi:predicted dehydrogenase